MHDTASSFRYKTVYRFEFAKNILKKTGDFFLNLIALCENDRSWWFSFYTIYQRLWQLKN